MEIEFLAWFEVVLSIENLNEKWGLRKYRFKISNFYLYCMTILIYFLQPFSCNPIVMEKSPLSSSLLLSMAFSRSDLQKQTWFQLTDRQGRGPLSDLIMGFIQSWIWAHRPGHSEKQICNEGEKGISWWSLVCAGGDHLDVFSYGKIMTFLGYQQSFLQALSECLMKCDGFIRQYSPRLGQALINYI